MGPSVVSLDYLLSIGLDVVPTSRSRRVAPRPDAKTRSKATQESLVAMPQTVLAPSDMTASSTLQVLALHGHAQTAAKFRGKIAALTKAVKSLAFFEFIEGPFLVPHNLHPPLGHNGSSNVFTWLDVEQAGDLGAGSCTSYVGIERSFDRILASRVDGIIGFSMGAAVLVSMLCHPEDGVELRQRLRFVGFFSGFLPLDPRLAGWIERTCFVSDLPSFHCIGRADEEIIAEKSEALASRFHDAVIYRHDGGHVVPAVARHAFKVFLATLPK
eukprot:TRINITY_DN34856_c0_g1_i1.p1 TRINITY_DN34856_c0_g1~~TRINITY_DN34856_c0_g1_i1.p1  ORF type:complete len:285 (-),score=45.13 TRINITY_DN34856_c0_g1_i1:174-986(-)